MGKQTTPKPNKHPKPQKGEKPRKPQPKAPVQEEVFPQYANDEDVPVFDPENMQANIQNQNRLRKKKKKLAERVVEEEPEEVREESPEIDVEDIQKEIEEAQEDQDLRGDEEADGAAENGEGAEAAEQGVEEEEEHIDGADIEGQPEVQPQPAKDLSLSIINTKIQEILSILSNFNALSAGRPRREYLNELKGHLRTYYDYNQQLIDHFLTFLNPNELVQLMQANQTQRPLTIRVNTLKTRRKELAQALIQRGVNLDPLAEWSKVGIKIYESRVPIGATPQYLAGHYMLQSASSLLPVMALDARPGERVLDMAAAPGGKTTYIAQTMKNTGVVVANDSKKERLRALQFNLQRLGVSNTIVTNYDGRKMTKVMNNFDRVLLDAPCTGLGIISKDPSIKAQKLLIDIQKHSHLQKQLLLSAIDCTKPNGIIVYSTCSVSPLQNEQVINYALRKRFIKVVEIGEFDVGEPGITKYMEKRYHQHIQLTRRIYPHTVNMDGFYVAKLVKVSNGEKKDKEEGEEAEPVEVEKENQKGGKEDKRQKKHKVQEQQEFVAEEEEEVPKPKLKNKEQQLSNAKQHIAKKHIQPEQPKISQTPPLEKAKNPKKKIKMRLADSPIAENDEVQVVPPEQPIQSQLIPKKTKKIKKQA